MRCYLYSDENSPMLNLRFLQIPFLLLIACCSITSADLFNDDFEGGASPLWGNELGNWTDNGGVYQATNPENFPNSHSSLPFQLVDFVLTVDITDIADGGIWLRSSLAQGTTIGRTGVLLVAGPNGGAYWHNVTDPGTYGASLNVMNGLFTPNVSDVTLQIVVSGDEYALYVDGSNTAATTLTSDSFASGQIALYDNSSQHFDNVVVTVPEPSAVALIAALCVGFARRRRFN